MATADSWNKLSSSFRDPSGFLFIREGVLYRQVNGSYREDYDPLLSSGLYDALTEKKLLVPHREAEIRSRSPSSPTPTSGRSASCGMPPWPPWRSRRGRWRLG